MVSMDSSSLAAITSLKKLVNHPDLVYPACREAKEGFENAAQYYPANYDPDKGRLRPELSGKLSILDCLLAVVKSTTTDKGSTGPRNMILKTKFYFCIIWDPKKELIWCKGEKRFLIQQFFL